MSKEYKHSEQTEPNGPGQKRYKISYFAFQNGKPIRAYKILFAYDQQDAKKRADLYKPLIYDVTEI